MKKINNLKNKHIAIILILVLGVFMMVLPVNNNQDNEISDSDNSFELESKISRMLKDTYSLDKVSVILTFDTNGEKIYDYEDNTNALTQNKDSLVKSEKLPYVRGALIAVNNIDYDTSEKIKDAIAILLGISKDKVTVIYN